MRHAHKRYVQYWAAHSPTFIVCIVLVVPMFRRVLLLVHKQKLETRRAKITRYDVTNYVYYCTYIHMYVISRWLALTNALKYFSRLGFRSKIYIVHYFFFFLFFLFPLNKCNNLLIGWGSGRAAALFFFFFFFLPRISQYTRARISRRQCLYSTPVVCVRRGPFHFLSFFAPSSPGRGGTWRHALLSMFILVITHILAISPH